MTQYTPMSGTSTAPLISNNAGSITTGTAAGGAGAAAAGTTVMGVFAPLQPQTTAPPGVYDPTQLQSAATAYAYAGGYPSGMGVSVGGQYMAMPVSMPVQAVPVSLHQQLVMQQQHQQQQQQAMAAVQQQQQQLMQQQHMQQLATQPQYIQTGGAGPNASAQYQIGGAYHQPLTRQPNSAAGSLTQPPQQPSPQQQQQQVMVVQYAAPPQQLTATQPPSQTAGSNQQLQSQVQAAVVHPSHASHGPLQTALLHSQQQAALGAPASHKQTPCMYWSSNR